MLARLLVLIVLYAAFPPTAHAQSTDSPIALHLRFVKLDPRAEAAIASYLTPATAVEGISVAPLPAGVTPSDLIRRASAAGNIEILAEPNILADDGREATFRAGSSFPVPRVDPDSGQLAVVWRDFGLRLDLLPTVNATGIDLRVVSEVSFLDYRQAVTVNGFTVPGISRRMSVQQLDLAGGQGFAIGGLVDPDQVASYSKLPGLMDMPLLRDIAASGGAKVLALVTAEIPRR